MSAVAGHDFVLDPAVSRRPANVSLQLPGLASTPASLDTVDTSSKQFVTSHISFSNKSASKQTQSQTPTSANNQQTTSVHSSPSKLDVDNFVPDDGGFDNFLDETDSARSKPSLAVDNNLDSRYTYDSFY